METVTESIAPKCEESLDIPALTKPHSVSDEHKHRQTILRSNSHLAAEILFHKRPWDINLFSRDDNLPVVVGALKQTSKFSMLHGDVGFRFLDLPLHMPGKGWQVPCELAQFSELLSKISDHERLINPEFDKHYVYITVDQADVPPDKTQRRPGWHSDSYITMETRIDTSDDSLKQTMQPTDNIYVISDNIPTEYSPGPFSLEGIDPEDCASVLNRFKECAQNATPLTYPSYTILRLDPYAIHRPSVNKSNHTTQRTFVKVSVSQNIYNKTGNAHNSLFAYSWPMVPRDSEVRNHPNTLTGWDREDREKFQLINSKDVDFDSTRIDIDWAKPNLYYAIKTEGVKAERAIEGEHLATIVDGFVVTENVAQKGAWKITSSLGDQYFLSDRQFRKFYNEVADENGIYQSKFIPVKFATLTKDVCLLAPWGGLQYAPAGSKLVQKDANDIYVVHASNFSATYHAASSVNTLFQRYKKTKSKPPESNDADHVSNQKSSLPKFH